MSGSSEKTVLMGHGGGGKKTGRHIRDLILPNLNRGRLGKLPDSVVLDNFGSKLAYTTDSFVVSPLFFPGGDIGCLAVHGTCNDLACSGARPHFLSLGMILEEGFSMEKLERIIRSISAAADEAGVEIVTGDTKVVPKGSADGIFLNTSGIGKVESMFPLGTDQIEAGDLVLVSGPVGNHGLAVMLSRAEFSFDFELKSDSQSIWPIVEKLIELGPGLKFLRDPTRGGIAATLNEIASSSGKEIEVDEASIPVDESVAMASDILGIDPLQAANEGKVIAVVSAECKNSVIEKLSGLKQAEGFAFVGGISEKNSSKVILKTRIGGRRVLAEPSGELLPRIC